MWGLVLATYVSVVTRTALVWLLSSWRPSARLMSWSMYRELSRYGRPVFIGELLRETGRAGSAAVVGRMLGTALLAEFRYALQLVNQSILPIIYGSANVLLPALSRIGRDRERFAAAVVRALHVLSLVVFPIGLTFVALGDPIAIVLFGDAWSGAGPIITALGGVGIALVMDSVASESFKALGRTDLLPRMHALSATVPVLLLLALADRGATAIGLAITAGALCVAAYGITALSRASGIPLIVLLRALVPALAAATFAAVTMAGLDSVLHAARGGTRGFVLLCLELAAGVVAYLGSMRVVAPSSFAELRFVVRSLVSGAKAGEDAGACSG